MMRLLAGLLLALAIAAPALAADGPVRLTLDGRPIDRQGGSAVTHGGVVYGDLLDLVKSFDGLLTYHGPSVEVTLNGKTVRFTRGSRTAQLGEEAVTMRGAPFLRQGEMFVPLDFFVTKVAGAKLRVNPARTRANIYVNANPLS
ncbi:stalk domain-containing protein [Vulcanimicrobium alpinum]|nr:stalk domain-containing protein [Vulcanimicrobium alpinum]